MKSALTPEQVAYVNSQMGQKNMAELAREMGCSRNGIAGHWSRYRQKNGIAPSPMVVRNKERDDAIFALYRDEEKTASQIAVEMDLRIWVVEGALKKMRALHKMPARGKPKSQGRRSRQRYKPSQNENRVIGMDGKPLPFHARPVPIKEGVMPISFEELDDVAMGHESICRCRHYVGTALATPTMYCGEPSEPGKPYCDFHLIIAYRAGTAVPLTDERKAELKHIGADFLRWRKAKDELPVAA